MIINGDCLLELPKIPNKTCQLVIVDPPYFLLKQHKWDNQWKSELEYIEWCKVWFKECHRILKDDGAFYCFQDWRLVSEYVIELKKIFPFFQNWITWERIKGRASNTNWKSSKEEILYFSKSGSPKFFPEKKIRPVIAPYKDKDDKPKGWFVDEEGNRVRWTGIGNVWHYTPPVWSSKEEKPFHPTQKPIMMIERIIRAHTEDNDIILDCFAGSGTTGAAAKKLGRKYILIEKEIEYFNKIKERLL